MTTTALVAEILIVGFQVLIWMSGFIFSLLIQPSYVNKFLNNSPTIALFIIVVVSYLLGIVFEYIISGVFSIFRSSSEKEIYKNVESIRLRSGDHEVHKYLDNHHLRLKVSRSIFFNLPVLTLSAVTFIHNVKVDLLVSTCQMKWTIIISGLFLFILAWISWYKRNKRYLEFIEQTKKLPWYKKIIAEMESEG